MGYITKSTPCGEIKGLNGEKCYEFRGVRYARAERYEMPVEQEKWDGVYDATEYKRVTVFGKNL